MKRGTRRRRELRVELKAAGTPRGRLERNIPAGYAQDWMRTHEGVREVRESWVAGGVGKHSGRYESTVAGVLRDSARAVPEG